MKVEPGIYNGCFKYYAIDDNTYIDIEFLVDSDDGAIKAGDRRERVVLEKNGDKVDYIISNGFIRNYKLIKKLDYYWLEDEKIVWHKTVEKWDGTGVL